MNWRLHIDNFRAPTPKNVKQFAKGLRALYTFMTTAALYEGNHTAAVIFFCVGAAADFLLAFTADDDTPTPAI
jgi:hypothetical protein